MTEQMDCPICMEVIGETNNITTECGHCFHASCIMTNVSRNGFSCPCCRAQMAEEEEYDEEDDYDDEEDDSFIETIESANELPDVLAPIDELVSQVLSSDIATEDFIRYILYDTYGYVSLRETYEEVSSQIETMYSQYNRRNDVPDLAPEEDDDEDDEEDQEYEDDESVDTHDDDDENWCKSCIPHHYAECGSECRANHPAKRRRTTEGTTVEGTTVEGTAAMEGPTVRIRTVIDLTEETPSVSLSKEDLKFVAKIKGHYRAESRPTEEEEEEWITTIRELAKMKGHANDANQYALEDEEDAEWLSAIHQLDIVLNS